MTPATMGTCCFCGRPITKVDLRDVARVEIYLQRVDEPEIVRPTGLIAHGDCARRSPLERVVDPR